MYRINYGNGQVSVTFKSLAAAKRDLALQTMYQEFMRIERYLGDGEWARVRS